MVSLTTAHNKRAKENYAVTKSWGKERGEVLESMRRRIESAERGSEGTKGDVG